MDILQEITVTEVAHHILLDIFFKVARFELRNFLSAFQLFPWSVEDEVLDTFELD